MPCMDRARLRTHMCGHGSPRHFSSRRTVSLAGAAWSCLCSIGGRTLGNVIGAWKGRSARQANLVRESTGAFWSKDYFDRLVRDTDHFRRCARYIRRNPEKAGVGNDKFTLLESRFVKKMLAAA